MNAWRIRAGLLSCRGGGGAGGGVAVALQGARAHAVARGLDETVGFPRPRLSAARPDEKNSLFSMAVAEKLKSCFQKTKVAINHLHPSLVECIWAFVLSAILLPNTILVCRLSICT